MNLAEPVQNGVLAFAGLILGLFALRQCLIIWAAEQGRKHDLVKKLYKQNQELHLSVLIPFLDAGDHPALLALLQAINEQDYPTAKVTVHLVTTQASSRDLIPQSLRPNVKVWQYPTIGKKPARYGHAVTWLIDRCLAAGGNGLLVFLKPTDMIKPDFFQNLAARGIDSFAIQGYVALKNPPETPLAKMLALSTRIFNRIGNAGRYHMGLSCRLLDSGWAIKQEVLEMIPYRRGTDLDNLEYSIRLNLENFRVNWAPNVVVYSDSDVHFLHHLTLCVGAAFNRINLLLQYGPRLLTRLILRFDLNYLEQLTAIVRPSDFLTLAAFATLAILDAKSAIPIPGEPLWWAAAACAVIVLNVVSLAVARCKPNDYITLFVYTPVVYVFGLVALPLGFFTYFSQAVIRSGGKEGSYRRAQTTRFNEAMEAPPSLFDEDQGENVIRNILKKNAPKNELEFEELVNRAERRLKKNPAHKHPDRIDLPQASHNQQAAPQVTSRMKLPRETVKSVPLSNGKKEVQCTLKTLTTFNESGNESYQLTLEYKSVAFSTESYRILDQAFYELHAKLISRSLTIMACGSCGNFYNPTADVPGALRNSGVCLFGKKGKEVNLNTDAVTVMSQACSYHCPLEQRESIVRQWKESLTLSRSK